MWASSLEIKSGGGLRDKDGVYRCYIPVPSREPSPAPSLGACGLCPVHSWILQRRDGVSSGILSHRILSLGHTRVHLPLERWVWNHWEMPQHAPPHFVLSGALQEGRST